MPATPEPKSEALSDTVTGLEYQLAQAPPLQVIDEAGGVVSGPLPAPMTSPTVLMTVPLAERGPSQSSSALRFVGLTASVVPQFVQTLWNMNTTQPPPEFSTDVT